MAEKTYVVLLKDGRSCKVKADSVSANSSMLQFLKSTITVGVFFAAETTGMYEESSGELTPAPPKPGSKVLA